MCCVFGCKTNYRSNKSVQEGRKISVFRFPKDADERKAWVAVIPNANLVVKDHTVVCELHWPTGYETVKKKGKLRPKYPPSIWPNVPLSQIPTPTAAPRTTHYASSSVRNQLEDQLSDHVKADNVTFDVLKDKLITSDVNLPAPVISFMENDILHIISKEMKNGVPLFIVKISQDLTFENYHLGIKCISKTLSVNRITTLNKWSRLEENIRFLKFLEIDQKKNIIHQQLQVMGPPCIGTPLYESECIVRAFEYFSRSRSLYHRLRKDFQLPSIQTLTRITSRVAKKDEKSFLTGVFKCLPEDQKICVLMQDEVYVKKNVAVSWWGSIWQEC